MKDFVFEAVPYTENIPHGVDEAIRARVSLMEDDIIYFNEIPIPSVFSIDIVFDAIHKLALEKTKCAILINLISCIPPGAVARKHINKRFRELGENTESIKHVAYYTGRNFIINTAAKFVMYQTTIKSFSVDKHREQAMEKIQAALNS